MAKITPTKIPEVVIIDADEYHDDRGYFTRLFRDNEIYPDIASRYKIREINRSYTRLEGTIRGLHMQTSPFEQDKMVQCLIGRILDVAVDMRPDSPTYLQHVGVELSDNRMLLVPKGFAHGFQTLSPHCVVQYFVSAYFAPAYERGYRYNDPKLNIDWPVKEITTSEKDANWPLI